jgi:hypothetical protein
MVALIHAVLDASSQQEVELALAKLRAHDLGAGLARLLEDHLDAALIHLNACNRGLPRLTPLALGAQETPARAKRTETCPLIEHQHNHLLSQQRIEPSLMA